MRITASWLESRKLPKNRPQERYDVTVDGRKGLMVRVHESGAVSFRFRYARDGRRLVMVLGEFGRDGLSLSEAFRQHDTARQEIERGLDPIEERAKRDEALRTERARRAGAGTVAEVVGQFCHLRLRGETWNQDTQSWTRDPRTSARSLKRPEQIEAVLRRHLLEVTLDGERLGKLPVHAITRRHLVRLLTCIADAGHPVMANRVHSHLKTLFTWLAARETIPASPMAGIERPGGTERPRTRYLTTAEIRIFWEKLATAEMAEATRLALKLLLATGQRRGEITHAKWAHFDLKGKLWTIPTELVKSATTRRAGAEAHRVPLSPLALDLLRMLKGLAGPSEYVLPSPHDPTRPYWHTTLSNALRHNARHFGIPEFTVHDLRRTCRTGLTSLRVPREVAERILNHAPPRLEATYDRHEPLAEMRTALERWGGHLKAIIEGNEQTVVALTRAAG